MKSHFVAFRSEVFLLRPADFREPSRDFFGRISHGDVSLWCNGLETCENVGLKLGRVGLISAVFFIVSVGIAVPTALWATYNWGEHNNPWLEKKIPDAVFNTAAKASKKSPPGESKT